MTIIGDVHGKVQKWEFLITHDTESICVGDFGFKIHWDYYIKHYKNSTHTINMGNHDYLPYLNFSLGNYAFNSKYNLMTIRGAYSIDKRLRREGIDWFDNEELTYQECQEVVDQYSLLKPEIIVSHDCPQDVQEYLFGYEDSTITRNVLQSCLETHQPALWLFGHHHKSIKEKIENTMFICLNELETFKIK